MHKLAYLVLLPLGIHRYEGVPRNADDLSLRPVRWSVVGGGVPRSVVVGRTVRITVQAEIAKGWHIYSLTQKPGGPIPLRLELVGPADVLMRGVIDAPKPDRTSDKVCLPPRTDKLDVALRVTGRK